MQAVLLCIRVVYRFFYTEVFAREHRVFAFGINVLQHYVFTHIFVSNERQFLTHTRSKSMYSIPVLLGTVRSGRQSIKPARYVVSQLAAMPDVQTELIDLQEYEFPFLEKQFRFQEQPTEAMVRFQQKIESADALIIVSPEYNGGYPGVLKNALDYFLPEYKRKPIGLVTVSGGALGGINAMQQLRQLCFGLGTFAVPVALTVPKVGETFDADGTLLDAGFEQRTTRFLDEVLWYTQAIVAQRQRV